MIRALSAVLGLALGLSGMPVAHAADTPPSTQSLRNPSDCKQASATPATKPAPASNDGTAPGNAGSTGWSGGTGGSHIGTSQNGAATSSKSFQPAVARGLDPIAPQPAAAHC